jgi:hypothetical protein
METSKNMFDSFVDAYVESTIPFLRIVKIADLSAKKRKTPPSLQSLPIIAPELLTTGCI